MLQQLWVTVTKELRKTKIGFVVPVLLLACLLLLPSGRSQSPYFGCYSDSVCKSAVSSIDWGTLAPGGSVERSLYVKNLDDARLSGLSFGMVDVVPEGAEKYLRLESSVGSASLSKYDVSEAELTLYVDPQISDVSDFGFGVLVTASFSESSSEASDLPTGEPGGWLGDDTDFEDTVKIPSGRDSGGLSSGLQVVFGLVLVVCVYLVFKDKI